MIQIQGRKDQINQGRLQKKFRQILAAAPDQEANIHAYEDKDSVTRLNIFTVFYANKLPTGECFETNFATLIDSCFWSH